MSFWAYILRLSNGIYYTGHTDDLDRRIAEHKSGAFRGYTDDKRPLELMWAGRAQDQKLVTCEEGSVDRRGLGEAEAFRGPAWGAWSTSLDFARRDPWTSLGTNGLG